MSKKYILFDVKWIGRVFGAPEIQHGVKQHPI